MTRSSWDMVWADVARAVSRRSSCDRAQVGAVIVKDSRVVSTGYNGPASSYPADTAIGCRGWCVRAAGKDPDPSSSYGYGCPSIHAEANALLAVGRGATSGSTMYCTHAPCADCAKLISASGVARLVILNPLEQHRPDPTVYLEGCGIEIKVVAL